ncbi:MAG: BatD family protein [Ferruginibacter sp.]
MDNRKMRGFFLTVIMACCSFLLSYAQPLIKTNVDKSEILIGDQFKLTIEASLLPDAYKINWPAIPDSLQHFEVISRSKIDSVYSNNRLSGIAQTFTLTSFDSGKWVLPPFLITMAPPQGDTTYNYFTDSVPVTVSFSTSDTSSQLRDIKPIREVEIADKLWYWIAAGILLVALAVWLVWYFKRRKKKKPVVSIQSKFSPYDEAMMELDKLKSYNLTQPGDIKIVHTRLGEILKRYLSRMQNNDYLNKTTSDMLILLRDQTLDIDMPAKAAASLRLGDAVKFAKYLPPAYESEESIQSIKSVIQTLQVEIHNTNAPKQ